MSDISLQMTDDGDINLSIEGIPTWGNITGTLSNQTDLQAALDLKADDADLTAHMADTTTHGTTGDIVGTSDTQTLTNKTLTTPTIGDFTNATHTHADASNGGQIDHADLTTIGTNTHAQIDSHIASASNPHSVTLEQARTQNSQLSGSIDMNSNIFYLDQSANAYVKYNSATGEIEMWVGGSIRAAF